MKKNCGLAAAIRLFAALLSLCLLLPLSAGTEAIVEDIDLSSPWNYALPIDFSAGAEPKAEGFSQSKDENGGTVRVYEDSTIRAVITETRYFLPGDKAGTDIWMADIIISDPSQLRTASTGKGHDFSRVSPEEILPLAKEMKAVVALDGDSVGAKNEKHNFAVIHRQGQTLYTRLDDSGKYRMDLLLIDENGDFHGIHAAKGGDLDDPSVYQGKKIFNVFSFGPILVEDGAVVADYQGVDRARNEGGTWMRMRTNELSQRVALCQAGPLHYQVITCAGHRSGNRGLTLPEFSEYCLAQGVQFAYNMDGGDSSFLYFSGYGKVNMRNTKVRGLWDIVYFASAEQ